MYVLRRTYATLKPLLPHCTQSYAFGLKPLPAYVLCKWPQFFASVLCLLANISEQRTVYANYISLSNKVLLFQTWNLKAFISRCLHFLDNPKLIKKISNRSSSSVKLLESFFQTLIETNSFIKAAIVGFQRNNWDMKPFEFIES